MAVNQNHTENRRGAVIPYGESVLKQCPDVDLSFLQQPVGSNLFSGTKRGMLFLTSYRVIFVTSHSISDPMLSFMMPFDLMSNCTVEQPVFAPNYIKGTIQANPDGGWEGQATFKLAFRRGGAILFFELMMKAASAAAHGVPLGSINDWFGAPGLFIITGQGSMVCSQRMPCAAHPVVVYGSQPVRYRAPLGAYGSLPAEYEAPPRRYEALPLGYRAPPPGYGVPPARYGVPPIQYGLPPAGYGVPPIQYGLPPAGYGVPPIQYGVPPAGYGVPPIQYGVPPAGYGTPPARNELPPPRYEAPPSRNRTEPHDSVAAQPPGNEASLPSTSSSQAHIPPPKK